MPLSTDDAPLEWRVERVSYPAAYGDERIPAVLFLPKNSRPPYQTVIFFPGSNVLTEPSAWRYRRRADYIMKRPGDVISDLQAHTNAATGCATPSRPRQRSFGINTIMWSKDIGRSIDYLESRPDIARDRLGFLGLSWGAAMAPLFLALEPRIKAAVLLGPGFFMQAALPEADPVNFAPRVRMPVLMLNGRFDFLISDRQLAGTDVQAARDTRRP